jgi:hypothetical protein
MRRALRRSLICAAVGMNLMAGAHGASAQCTKDIECKGDRICRDGTCNDPGPAVVLPVASDPASTATAAPAETEKPAVQGTEGLLMEPRSPAMRTTGVVLTGLGTATLVAAVVFGVDSYAEHNSLETACPNHLCPPEQGSRLSEASSLGTASTISALCAAALLGTGIPLYFVGRHEVPASSRAAAWWIPRDVSAGLQRVTVTFGF